MGVMMHISVENISRIQTTAYIYSSLGEHILKEVKNLSISLEVKKNEKSLRHMYLTKISNSSLKSNKVTERFSIVYIMKEIKHMKVVLKGDSNPVSSHFNVFFLISLYRIFHTFLYILHFNFQN